MGVAAKPCECDADKWSAVEPKELKIIEDSCQKIGRQWPIPYPWKRDPKELPNNEVQAKKKLEATERRLSRTPEHAAAYDRQMMEMTEMQIARKLTKQELETYKGPVHYIAHHEIGRPEKTTSICSLQLICFISRSPTEWLLDERTWSAKQPFWSHLTT